MTHNTEFDAVALNRAWLWECDDISFWCAVNAMQAEAERLGLDDWNDSILLAWLPA